MTISNMNNIHSKNVGQNHFVDVSGNVIIGYNKIEVCLNKSVSSPISACYG